MKTKIEFRQSILFGIIGSILCLMYLHFNGIYYISDLKVLVSAVSLLFQFSVFLISANLLLAGIKKNVLSLFVGIVLIIAFQNDYFNSQQQIWLGIIFSAGIGLLSARFKFLTRSGIKAAFFIGLFVFGFGGIMWSVPLLTFFLLSSIISKIAKREKEKFDSIFEKSSHRDAGQVFANGGIALLFLIANIFYPAKIFYFAYLGVIAAATADTWATEFGIQFGKQIRSVLTWKIVEKGTSGAVSIPGFTAAFSGAFIIALSGIFFVDGLAEPAVFIMISIVTVSGFLGALVDSLLGATLQGQFHCKTCGKITEKKLHCQGMPTRLVRGKKWINNDLVNLVCGLSGAMLVLLCLKIV